SQIAYEPSIGTFMDFQVPLKSRTQLLLKVLTQIPPCWSRKRASTANVGMPEFHGAKTVNVSTRRSYFISPPSVPSHKYDPSAIMQLAAFEFVKCRHVPLG